MKVMNLGEGAKGMEGGGGKKGITAWCNGSILQTREDVKEQKYSTRADLAVLQKSIYYTFQRCFLVEGRRKGAVPFKLRFKWLNAWVMLSNIAN